MANDSLMAECNNMDRTETCERFVPEDVEFLILEHFTMMIVIGMFETVQAVPEREALHIMPQYIR